MKALLKAYLKVPIACKNFVKKQLNQKHFTFVFIDLLAFIVQVKQMK